MVVVVKVAEGQGGGASHNVDGKCGVAVSRDRSRGHLSWLAGLSVVRRFAFVFSFTLARSSLPYNRERVCSVRLCVCV